MSNIIQYCSNTVNIILIISFFYSLEDCPAQPISDFDKDLRESSIQRRSINHSIRSYPGRKYKYEVREWMKELKKSIVDWNVCGCFYIIWVWVWVWVFWVFLCIGFLFYMLCRGVAYIINLSFRWAKKQLFLTHESCWYRGEEEFLAPGNRKSAIFERLIKQEF